jgi:hypothetical protein
MEFRITLAWRTTEYMLSLGMMDAHLNTHVRYASFSCFQLVCKLCPVNEQIAYSAIKLVTAVKNFLSGPTDGVPMHWGRRAALGEWGATERGRESLRVYKDNETSQDCSMVGEGYSLVSFNDTCRSQQYGPLTPNGLILFTLTSRRCGRAHLIPFCPLCLSWQRKTTTAQRGGNELGIWSIRSIFWRGGTKDSVIHYPPVH